MKLNDWGPAADNEAIRARARMLRGIRAFFDAREVLEVETPLLASFGASDPHIGNLVVQEDAQRYLQTSPEYAMKRLLAADIGDIYQITRAFRPAETGRLHNPEFTILEWYRLAMDHQALMLEVDALLSQLFEGRLHQQAALLSYQQVFQEQLGLDPLSCEIQALEGKARELDVMPESSLDRDGLLDLLMSLVIVPALPGGRLTFIHDWPVSQAALARRLPDQPGCAARFEVYCGGLELANGFWELSDAKEQARRFEADNRMRLSLGLPEVPADTYLLSAMQSGLPDCAGVAVGLDRVLMLMLDRSSISDVLCFPWDRS
jgi:elongation factor P--(R)-beta-lysine ligase